MYWLKIKWLNVNVKINNSWSLVGQVPIVSLFAVFYCSIHQMFFISCFFFFNENKPSSDIRVCPRLADLKHSLHMLMLQCLITEWIVCLSQPLVSALCNFSERVGSQHYIHVYFNKFSTHDIVMTSWVLLVVCTYIMSDTLSQTWDLDLPQWGWNHDGRQITQNDFLNFYIMLL